MESALGPPMGVNFVKKVKFTFPDSLIKRPLVHEMSQMYDIVTNIEKADVGATSGWVIVGVSGTEDELDRAFQWMSDQGVCVQTMLSGV